MDGAAGFQHAPAEGRTNPRQDAAPGLEKGMIHHSEMEIGFTPVLKMLKYKSTKPRKWS